MLQDCRAGSGSIAPAVVQIGTQEIAPVLRVELRRKVRRPHDGAVRVNGPTGHALKGTTACGAQQTTGVDELKRPFCLSVQTRAAIFAQTTAPANRSARSRCGGRDDLLPCILRQRVMADCTS